MDQNRPTLLGDLTPRDIDVIKLIGEGLSNPEIAERLVLEISTVKWYVRQLYSKLHIDDELSPRQRRLRLIEVARIRGLLNEASTPSDSPHNLPAQTTAFIGREDELVVLRRYLKEPLTRLITLLAPGGMGKTRLALEAAREQLNLPACADGVYFVPLQALSSPDHLVSAIGEHSNFQFINDERTPKQQLLDYLRYKQMLLVLDNFEHLLAGADLVSEMLTAAPGLRVLVTSREKLNLLTETVFTVGGMVVPDAGQADAAGDYEAVRLFVQMATRLRPDFTANEVDHAHITDICQLVEGMPLGIILAAAWVEVLSLAEIATEIRHSMDILAAEMRDVPRRHWSIRAVFEPTWERLSAAEQDVFMKFSVFRGGCTREAAQAVTGVTLPQLQALVNKALLTRSAEGRYEIHELLRQYAASKLAEAGQSDTAYDVHYRYYTDFLRQRETDLRGSRQREALDEIEADFENVRAAWLRAAEQRDIEAIGGALFSLDVYCQFRGRFGPALALFSAARHALAPAPGQDPHPVWGKLLVTFPETGARPEEGLGPFRVLAEEYLRIAYQSEDPLTIADAQLALGNATDTEESDLALELLNASLKTFRDMREDFVASWALINIGFRHIILGNRAAAVEAWQACVEINRRTNNRLSSNMALNNLASIALGEGDYQKSYILFTERLEQAREMGDRHTIARSLGSFAFYHFLSGDFETVRDYLDHSARIVNDLGLPGRHVLVDAMLSILDGNYEQAAQRCAADLAFEKISQTTKSEDIIYWLHAIAALGMDDYATLEHCLLTMFSEFVRWNQGDDPAVKSWYMPLTAAVLAHVQQIDRAAEIFALGCTHPASVTGWLQLPVMRKFRFDLESQLSPEAFAAAWERGQSFDLDTVIEDLLQRWANATTD